MWILGYIGTEHGRMNLSDTANFAAHLLADTLMYSVGVCFVCLLEPMSVLEAASWCTSLRLNVDRPWSPGALMHIRHCARRSSCHILATCLYRGDSVTSLAARIELAAQRSLNYRRKHSLTAVVDNARSMYAYYPRQFMFILARMAPQGACALGHTPLSPIMHHNRESRA